MTAQEIFEREGFLIAASNRKCEPGQCIPGDVVTGCGAGSLMAVIGEATPAENWDFWCRYGIAPEDAPFYYKVVAE